MYSTIFPVFFQYNTVLLLKFYTFKFFCKAQIEKMNFIKLIPFYLLLHLSLNAEQVQFSNFTPRLIFSFQNTYYVMDKDTLSSSEDVIHWKKEAHGLKIDHITSFAFLEHDSIGYLYQQGGGVIYKFDGQKFNKNKSLYPLRTHYNSIPVVFENQLHFFTGYGLFEFRNDIIYYDTLKSEWEVLAPKTPIKKTLQRRMFALGQFDKNDAYIGMGMGLSESKENAYVQPIKLNDVWKFNFKNKTWQKLGIIQPELITETTTQHTINFKSGNLVLTHENYFNYKVYFVDLKSNILIKYQDFMQEVFNDVFLSPSIEIIYNNHTHRFFALIKKETGFSIPTLFWEEDLLGSKTQSGKAYSKDKTTQTIIITVLIVVLILILFYLRRKFGRSNQQLVFDLLAKNTM